MPSFFEKLKKGMGLEEKPQEEVEKEPPKIKKPPKKLRELKIKPPPREPEVKVKEIAEEKEVKEGPLSPPFAIAREPEEKIEISREEVPVEREKGGKEKKWFEPEGELAVDVYQTETDLVIQSAIAGVRPEDLEITMERDILTIKGSREKPFVEEGDYFSQECYWGPFSREIILPVEIDPDKAEATMKEGILTLRLPKILREKKRRIKVRI